MEEILRRLAECIERGKVKRDSPYPPELKGQDGADELTRQAIDAGIAPGAILNGGLIAGMLSIGEKFRDNEVFVPEVLMAAKAMAAATEHLKPFFLSGAIKRRGTVIIGTVAGDLHDIGKKIVGMMLEGGGWEVVDLGVDVGADRFVGELEARPGAIVGLSALLTTTMLNMESIVREIKARHPETVVLVGGAPLTMDFARRIQADYYSPDPQGALDYINRLSA